MQSRDASVEAKINHFSIYDETKKIIDKFKNLSDAVKAKEELQDNPYKEDEYREECRKLRGARITRDETGLSSEQFYAVSELVELACGSNESKEIECIVRQGSEDLELMTKYKDQNFIPGRLAPLGKV